LNREDMEKLLSDILTEFTAFSAKANERLKSIDEKFERVPESIEHAILKHASTCSGNKGLSNKQIAGIVSAVAVAAGLAGKFLF